MPQLAAALLLLLALLGRDAGQETRAPAPPALDAPPLAALPGDEDEDDSDDEEDDEEDVCLTGEPSSRQARA